MQDWAQPNTLGQWLRRLFGLQAIICGLLVILLVVSELRFDWIEKAVGAYLATINDRRPQIGAIWEKGHQATTARKVLEQIVTDRQASRRDALEAESFKQLAERIPDGQGTMLSPDHFKRLYLKLPIEIAREIAAPVELLALFSEAAWDRTYFEKNDDQLTVYLLDAENRVLKQMTVSADLLLYADRKNVFTAATLSDLPQFKDRLYPGDHFFKVLAELPVDIRKAAVPHPEKLLALPGLIRRVGISDEAGSGYIELGFEVDTGTRQEVVRFQGQEWAVWHLRSVLDGKPQATETLSDFLRDLRLR
ncbi:MAG: hypothetical protein [Olavius algarvensis Delta 4 endosymbiont]|nr:MAG: hypothetical protein [Olavius algarvensis Delta 4 endosymbiont]